jgi:hypothetical protein
MKKALIFVSAILYAGISLQASAQSTDPDSNRGEKPGVKQSIKNSAAKTKRALAVARCNDGRYSYTHHKTCNKHGGVMTRYR